jgi:predicted CXXCH cytochrome family protein
MIMRTTLILVGLGALALLWGLADATDDPHGAADSIYCEQCHISHNTLGDILINSTDDLVSTLCLSCHTPGGWVGMTKTLSSSQKADPGTSGTSHSWDVSATNPTYGADPPSQQVLLDHLAADGSITCATCHDPHENSTSPFLRLDNSADALCLDCHSQRNMGSVRTYTGSPLSHPVGVSLPATATYHNPPLDVDGNPQPSDGNTTNDFVLNGGVVRCTSCHGVHYKDSNSGTVDGP